METQMAQTIKMNQSSRTVERCQICDHAKLDYVLFLGYLPPVNQMHTIGQFPHEQPSYPALLLNCPQCQLVQLGLIVNPEVLFPPEYPYTSGTTKILRDNFADLYQEVTTLISLKKEDLVVDVGSNDGTLLSNFIKNHRVQGITPEDIGNLARENGIDTITSYFNQSAVSQVLKGKGKAKVVTATNVFAHIDHVHEVVENILDLLAKDGVFISESHYLPDLVETLQYDTIYHEHLRYYSLHSIGFLLEKHGLEIFHVKKIPTHGGSIRVYASPKGNYPARESVEKLLSEERKNLFSKERIKEFQERVVETKLTLNALLLGIKQRHKRIVGIGAPSRASTLINYCGIDDGILESVLEIKGSYKIGKYIPGTLIPVREESILYTEQPEYAMLLSWHIAEELAPKLKEKGYRGDFIIPLSQPRILRNAEV